MVLFYYFSYSKTIAMRKLIFALFVSAGWITMCGAQTKNARGPYEIQEKTVIETLKFLSSDELEGRDSGSEGIEKAALYLEELFIKHSIKPYFATYRDTLPDIFGPAYNIVGVIEGNDPKLKSEYVVIGAHYDHIGVALTDVNGDVIFNGADDNASGVTAVAELAAYFSSTRSNKRSLLFCFFSAEEKGLLGSWHLAEKLKKQGFNLYTMLNFEMIGVPLKKDITAFITGYSRSNMAQKFNEYAGEKLVGYLDFEVKYQLFRASDNYPFFMEFNAPAHTLSTTDMETFPYYHHVDDEFEIMDTGHMTDFIRKMVPLVEKMTGTETRDIVLKK